MKTVNVFTEIEKNHLIRIYVLPCYRKLDNLDGTIWNTLGLNIQVSYICNNISSNIQQWKCVKPSHSSLCFSEKTKSHNSYRKTVSCSSLRDENERVSLSTYIKPTYLFQKYNLVASKRALKDPSGNSYLQ